MQGILDGSLLMNSRDGNRDGKCEKCEQLRRMLGETLCGKAVKNRDKQKNSFGIFWRIFKFVGEMEWDNVG
jgi:hypothetical protein